MRQKKKDHTRPPVGLQGPRIKGSVSFFFKNVQGLYTPNLKNLEKKNLLLKRAPSIKIKIKNKL